MAALGDRAYYQYALPIFSLLHNGVSGAPFMSTDDGRCGSKTSGIYVSSDSCSGFYFCGPDGRLDSEGDCPCEKIFHVDAENRGTCQQQNNFYYQNPLNCMHFHRCVKRGDDVIRSTYRCSSELGFNIYLPDPLCQPQADVAGCL